MTTRAKTGKGFFDSLKSVFATPSQCKEIALKEPFLLCKESIRIPLSNCPIEITLTGEQTLQLVAEQFIGATVSSCESPLLLFNPNTFYTRIDGFTWTNWRGPGI